jgi:hypothetical protein
MHSKPEIGAHFRCSSRKRNTLSTFSAVSNLGSACSAPSSKSNSTICCPIVLLSLAAKLTDCWTGTTASRVPCCSRICYTQKSVPTEHAARSPEILLEGLHRTRERGFALAVQEYEIGINAVAAPILDLSQQPIASVSVAGPTYRLTSERMIEIGPAVVAAAREIAHELELAAMPVEPSPAELVAGR